MCLVAGAMLLTAAWLFAPRAARPLYDGVPTVVDPYRYCQPVPGLTTSAPGSVDKPIDVTGGQSPLIAESTDENPPQAQLLVEQNGVVLPPGTTAVRVKFGCVPPPPVALQGRIDGNVYNFAVTAHDVPLSLRQGALATVVLRGPAGVPPAVIEELTGSGWTSLDTKPVGLVPHMYSANIPALGDVALVLPPASATTPQGGGGGSGAVIAIVGAVAVVVVAAAAILGLRLRPQPASRRRQR